MTVRYVVKEHVGIGYDRVLPFSFTKRKDAEKALTVLGLNFDTDITDLYVDEFLTVSSVELTDFIVTMESLAEKEQQRKVLELEREEYLSRNIDEYWNSDKEEILERPIPVWGRFNEDWWRHITPEMFEGHKDHYRELFESYGGGMLRALASRAPSLVDDYQKETKRISIYEKSLVEGYAININTVGGYNNIDVVETIQSWDEPR